MKHKERLMRMLEKGIISEAQFDSLNSSLQEEVALRKEEIKHRKIPMWIGALVAVINLLIVIAMIDFGGDVPIVSAEHTSAVEDIRQTLNKEGVGVMDSRLSTFLSIGLFGSFLLLPLLLFIWLHNNLVHLEEETHMAWSQVESNYQRRSDLIPNLIESVAGYMKHEAKVMTSVADARGGGIDESIEALINAQKEAGELLKEAGGAAPEDEAYLSMLAATQDRIGQLMHKLVATAEAYPNLKSSDQLLTLQAQLEGTENRINIARMRFNEAVGKFNSSMRRMPTSLIASMGNFRRKAYFKADNNADKAPKITFSDDKSDNSASERDTTVQ